MRTTTSNAYWAMQARAELSTVDNQPRNNLIFSGPNPNPNPNNRQITTIVSAGRTPVDFGNILSRINSDFEPLAATQRQTTALTQIIAPQPELRNRFEL